MGPPGGTVGTVRERGAHARDDGAAERAGLAEFEGVGVDERLAGPLLVFREMVWSSAFSWQALTRRCLRSKMASTMTGWTARPGGLRCPAR